MTFGDEIRQLLTERAFHMDRLVAIDAQLADARAALTAASSEASAERRPFSRLALLGSIGAEPRRTSDLLCLFEDVTETRLRAELRGLDAHAHITPFGKGSARRWGITSLGRQLLQRVAQQQSVAATPVAPVQPAAAAIEGPDRVAAVVEVVFSGRDSLLGDRPGYRSPLADI